MRRLCTRRLLPRHFSTPQVADGDRVLTIIRGLEAALLNPLVADIDTAIGLMDDLVAMGIEPPMSYFNECSHVLAVRREHRKLEKLLGALSENIFSPKTSLQVPQRSMSMRRGSLVTDGIHRLDPLSVITSRAVNSAVYNSANGGSSGMSLWSAVSGRGHRITRNTVLDLLKLYQQGKIKPPKHLFRKVAYIFSENRWDQAPTYQLQVLRTLQLSLTRSRPSSLHHAGETDSVRDIIASALSSLTEEGARTIRFEAMRSWLLASRVARSSEDPNGKLRAESMLLESFKLFDTALNYPAKRDVRQKKVVALESEVEDECREYRLSVVHLLEALEQEARLSSCRPVLPLPKLEQERNFTSKSTHYETLRGSIAFGDMMIELSGLGRYDELTNSLNRLFSSARPLQRDAAVVSNGPLDNSVVVLMNDIIASPIAEERGDSFPSQSPLSKSMMIEKLKANVFLNPPFGQWSDAKKVELPESDGSSLDWRAKMLTDVLRSSNFGHSRNRHMTYDERMGQVGSLALRLMAVAASHGIVLRDDFRAAWIDSLPAPGKKCPDRAPPLSSSMGDELLGVNRSPSHAILREDKTIESGLDSSCSSLPVHSSPASASFLYSTHRGEMEAVTSLTRETENALLSGANVDPKLEIRSGKDVRHENVTAIDTAHIIKHAEETIFGNFTVSSFSKSSRAGAPVLPRPAGDRARGALVRFICRHFADDNFSDCMVAVRRYGDMAEATLPLNAWQSVITACSRQCQLRTTDQELILKDLSDLLRAGDVMRRHPAVLKNLAHLYSKLNLGPDSLHALRSLRRSGISADFQTYQGVLLAIFKTRIDIERDEKHIKLFLSPKDTADWLLREMKRDAVQIPAEFYGDLMLLFVKSVRVMKLVEDSKFLSTSKGQVKASPVVAAFSKIEKYTFVDEAFSFVKRCLHHGLSRQYELKSERKLAEEKENSTGFVARTTLSGADFKYIIPKKRYGLILQRELLLRRLLIVLCTAGEFDRAQNLVRTSRTELGISASTCCYEVLFHDLLSINSDNVPRFVAAEDLVSEMVNNGVEVSGTIVDCFGRAHLAFSDASEALDVVQEMSTLHRSMPSPKFLVDLIEHSLIRNNVIEAKRAFRVIKDMKWDQPAVRPTVANKIRSSHSPDVAHSKLQGETNPTSTLVNSLVDAMRQLLSTLGSTASDREPHYVESIARHEEVIGKTGHSPSSNSTEYELQYKPSRKSFEEAWNNRIILLSDDSMRALFSKYKCSLDINGIMGPIN